LLTDSRKALLAYITKRIGLAFLVLFGCSIITFTVSRVAIPDPTRAWAGPRASQATIDALIARFHLHDPIYVQYFYYAADLLHGNWGADPATGQPVLGSILLYLPATVELTIAAILVVIAIGIPLGVVAATHKNKIEDHLSRLTALTGVASPPFMIGLLLQLVFFYSLHIFPDSGGRISPFIQAPPRVTGFLIIDSLLAGNLTAFGSAIQHIIMPAVALGFLNLGLMSRLVRASMLESLSSDYVRAVKAKGLRRLSVIYKHAFRNAMIQPVTVLGVYIAYMLGGSVVIESIFDWPGVGYYAAQAILNFDLPAVMGATLTFAIGVVLVNLLADIVYALLDPRIRLG
jgi:peptide/nickel transport system permease protein